MDAYLFGKIAHTGGWAALGGEPTLHPDLADILKVMRASGIADQIELWSNGSRLKLIKPEVWKSFDVLVLSIYPGKLTDEHIEWVAKKCEDEGVRLEGKDERAYNNWTEILEPEPTSPEITQHKMNTCWFRTFSRVINWGHFYQCCTSPVIPRALLGLPRETDGVCLEGLTEQGMNDFLNRSEPLKSCTVCRGRMTGRDTPIPWSEIKDREEWLRISSGG